MLFFDLSKRHPTPVVVLELCAQEKRLEPTHVHYFGTIGNIRKQSS